MNFGFDCDCNCGKCSWCCFKQFYAWGQGNTHSGGVIELGSGRADVPLRGTREPVIERQDLWIDAAVTDHGSWVIMPDGSLWGWGNNTPIGDGSSDPRTYPVLIDVGPWQRVFAFGNTRYAIKQDGSLWGWGYQLPSLASLATGEPPTNFNWRARLSAPIAGAAITNGGEYTTTPSVSITQQGGGSFVETPAVVTAVMKYQILSVQVDGGGNNYPFTPRPHVVVNAADEESEASPASFVVRTGHPVASVQISDPGSGYRSPPVVHFQGGSPPATATAEIAGGAVVAIHITNGGGGYESEPTVRFVGGSPARHAVASAALGLGSVLEVRTTSGGNYAHPPAIEMSSGNAAVSCTFSGEVVGINIIEPGSGYTSFAGRRSQVSGEVLARIPEDRPILRFSHGSATGVGTLAESAGIQSVERPPPQHQIDGVTVNSGGDNYPFRQRPTVIVTVPAGGAEISPASFVVRTRHPVAFFRIKDGGSGYKSPPQVQFQGGLPSPNATAVAEVSGGIVVAINITNAGGSYESEPAVMLVGGSPDRTAFALAELGLGTVREILTTNGGNYTQPPGVHLSAGNAIISRFVTSFTGGPSRVMSARSAETTGTVPAFSFVYSSRFSVLSAELIDGSDRRPAQVSRVSPPGFFAEPYDNVAMSETTGWKNRPRLRVSLREADQTIEYESMSGSFPVTEGDCLPVPYPQSEFGLSRKYYGIDNTGVAGVGVDAFQQFFSLRGMRAVVAASSGSPVTELRTSHGRVSAMGSSLGHRPWVQPTQGDSRPFDIHWQERLEMTGIPLTQTRSVSWIPPTLLTGDLFVNSANGYGCGGKVQFIVEQDGTLRPSVVRPGSGYTEEPFLVSPSSFGREAAVYPRLVDEGPGWTDVAAAVRRSDALPSIGIKDGLLYHWTGLIGSPSRVGKKAIVTATPKDHHSNGSVAALPVFWPLGFEDLRGGSVTAGFDIDFPDSTGGEPAILGSFLGRYARPRPRPPIQAESLLQVAYVDNLQDSHFFPVYEGQMAAVMHSVGHGYLSQPTLTVSEFCDFTATLELSGPDECISVSSAGGLLRALGSDGTLWTIGNNDIARPAPPVILFRVTEYSSQYEFLGFRFYPGGDGVAKVTTDVSFTTEVVPNGYVAKLTSPGEAYGRSEIEITLPVSVETSAVNVTITTGDLLCGGDFRPFARPTSRSETYTATYSRSAEASTVTVSRSLDAWRGNKILTPTEIYIGGRPSFGFDIFQGSSMTVYGEPTIHAVVPFGPGSGAKYELSEESEPFLHGPSAFSPEAVPGLSWEWIAGGPVFYGKLKDGQIARVATGFNEYFRCPVLPSGVMPGKGQVVVSQDGKLYGTGIHSPVSGQTSARPESRLGVIELIITSPGEGYTEPVSARFSSQAEGVAVAEAQIDGKVAVIMMTNQGAGWSSPPDVVLPGSARAEAIWGGPVESVSVTSGGSGYVVPPAVRFSTPGIPPANVVAVIGNGSVTSVSIPQGGGSFRQTPQVFFDPRPHIGSINVTAGGDGYTTPPFVLLAGGGGTGAAARSELNGSVDPATLLLTRPGGGYRLAPQVVFEGGGGTGATATCSLNGQGSIGSISLGSGGSGYTSSPTIRIVSVDGNGNGGAASCGIKGPVARIIVTQVGSGYDSAPLVFFQGGGGNGAAATAQMETVGEGATATARIDGRVLAVRITDAGSGYESSPVVSFSGGQNFRASGQDLVDSEFMPRARARIEATATSGTVINGGRFYTTHPRPNLPYNSGEMLALFNSPALIGITSGRSTMRNALDWLIPQVTSEYPGGPIESLSARTSPATFASRPEVVFPNSRTIECRTSLRIIGVATKPFRTPASRVIDSAPQALRGSGVDNRLFSREYRGASLRGDMLGSGGKVSRTRIPRLDDFPFDEPPDVVISCETGTGASLQLTLDGDGFFSPSGAFLSDSIDSPGENYGLLAMAFLRGGRRRVVLPQASAVIAGGVVVEVNVESPGSGYSAPPTVILSGGGGSGATGVAFLTEGSGARRGVFEVGLLSGGSGYKSPPKVDFVFAEPTLPPEATLPSAVQLADVLLEGVERFLAEGETRIEQHTLAAEVATLPLRDNQGYPQTMTIDYWIFYDDGFLAGVLMPNRQEATWNDFPESATVQVGGLCKSPATLEIIWPRWSLAASFDERNSVAVRKED